MESKEFVAQLRDVLAHLYDPAYLQSHPLADRLVDADTLGQMTRAQTLRRLLLDTLEELSPPVNGPTTAEDSAAYQALHYRYLDGLSVEEISNLLAMSPRQIYRKLKEGVAALASLLADRQQQSAPPPALPLATEATASPGQDRRSLAQAALQQLGSNARPELIAINDILATVVRDLRPYCEQIGATIQLAPVAQPFYVYADRTMVRQALLNLLTSGLDQVTAGLLQIMVTAADSEVAICFDLRPIPGTRTLVQTAAPRCAKREGIGLEVATQLFAMQNIEVHHTTAADRWQVTITMAQLGAQRILVIDDMPDIPLLFQRFTKAYAVEVYSAASGVEALRLLQEMTPSLILLDVMLPRHDGWEILQTLKSNPATAAIPVVICSILNEPGLARALGANSYLAKPVSQEALLQVLAQWLQPQPARGAAQP